MNRKRKSEQVHSNLKKYKTQDDLSKDVDIGDRVSIFAEDSDMDKKINDLCGSSTEHSNESDIDLDDIAQDLFDEDEVGPPLSEGLAELFTNIKEKPLPKNKISEKCKKILRPKNCYLETKKCNLEIWNNAIKSPERSRDIRIQKSNKLISKSTYALLNVTQDLIKLKNSKDNKPKIKDIIAQTTNAISLLVNAHNDSEQFRRDLIAKKLICSQKSIAKNVPSDSKLLFGDELSKRVKEANAANKLKIQSWKGTASSSTSTNSKNSKGSSKHPRGQNQGYKQNNNNNSNNYHGKNKKKKY